MTAEYELAMTAIRKATAKYNEASKAYRAGTIGDDEFLAAMKTYKEAEKVFDAAFAIEDEG